MLKKDLILRNPLRLIGYEGDDILSDGQFGAVLARAGVGKTAFLVQLALNSLLRDNNVLHVSLNDPVDKVVLWYREVLADITKQYNVGQVDQLWEAILPHRFIMTFKVEGFSVPRLEERLNDLTEQGIFIPRMILIDGFVFDESKRDSLLHLKELAKSSHIHVWFAVRTHRSEKSDPGSIPRPLAQMAEMFEVAIQLQPEGDKIHVRALKGVAATATSHPELLLDPSTMLIRNKS
ncbi:MAG: cytoplasmic protein [Deltaproteobacteria bacterium]|nr:cytoplasmic protein [Deltaproteobacteria bacterium]